MAGAMKIRINCLPGSALQHRHSREDGARSAPENGKVGFGDHATDFASRGMQADLDAVEGSNPSPRGCWICQKLQELTILGLNHP